MTDENRRRFPDRHGSSPATPYDNCLAYLDARLGELVDELERRGGVLEQTLVIVTADHGEELGEHALLFDHGESLYRAEIRVPLVIVPPAGRDQSPRPAVVDGKPVSLRDLAATVAEPRPPGDDVAIPGPVTAGGDPCDGRRLRKRATAPRRTPPVLSSELSSPNPGGSEPGPIARPSRLGARPPWPRVTRVHSRIQARRWRGVIQRRRDDPDELHNLAAPRRDGAVPRGRCGSGALYWVTGRAGNVGDVGGSPRVAAAPEVP